MDFFSSTQYETGVLQIPPLKFQTSLVSYWEDEKKSI
jgi:hypothetical protein